MQHRNKTIASLTLLFFLSVFPLSTQEIPLPEEEAATSLLETELGGADVDLFLEGSWESSLIGGIGWSWDNRNSGVRRSTLPDMADGYSFHQVPELTVSLWILDRYFFETKISEEEKLETYLLGYNGREDELVQKVRIGNTDIGYGNFGFLSLPQASKDSLGAYGLLRSESTEHHMAVRFDPAQKETRNYRGYNLIEETRLDLDEMVNGRFFILPDSNIENVRVYMRDEDGSVTGSGNGAGTYRVLGDDEVTVSAEEGLVFLNSPARSTLAVYYERNGTAVASDSTMGGDALCGYSGNRLDLGAAKIDFYWNGTIDDYLGVDLTRLQIGLSDQSADGLILYRPGQWSPFELRSTYDIGGTSGTGVETNSPLRFVEKGGTEGVSLPNIPFEDGLARVTGGPGIRSHESRYPLLPYLPEEELLYGPKRLESPEPPSKELLYEQKTPVGAFNLGENVLEGSIEVLRNGVPEYRYTFNPDTGEVNFFVPIAHSERIDISYRVAGGAFSEGELIAASANSLQFTETFGGALNLGLRWNVTDAAYTEEQNEATGSILVSGGSEWEKDNFSLALEGGLSVESPNTTGLRRFIGMDGDGRPVAFTPETLYPGAPGTFPKEFGKGERGKLIYRDMFSRNLGDNYALQPYDWDTPDDQIYPYGERVGPYPASTGSETEGDAMVLEYSLAAGEWVAGLVPLIHNEAPLDLSRMKAISMKTKHLDQDQLADIEMYIIAGSLPEDLDGDGRLDEEGSKYDDGFPFNHSGYDTMPVAPRLTRVPHSSMRNSEDLDGNGVLETPSTERLKNVTVLKGPIETANDWKEFTESLSPEERERLRASSAIQVVLVNTGGSARSGRLLVSELSLLGSSFSGGGKGTSGSFDVYESYLYEEGGNSSSYTSLLKQGEAGLFNGENSGKARICTFEWETKSSWTSRAYGKPVDLGSYRKLSFFMKTDTAPDSMTLSLRNPAGEGLAVTFSPRQHGEWRTYTWELDSSGSSRVLMDGEPVSSSSADYLSLDLEKKRNAEGVNRIDIDAQTAGADTGELHIDEFYFHDALPDPGGAGRSRLFYQHPGVLLGNANHPLMHDLTYENQVQVRSRNFASGFLEPNPGAVSFANDLSFGVYTSSVSIGYSGFYDREDFYPSAGYKLTVPLFNDFLTIEDAYRENHSYAGIEVDRSDSVKAGNREVATLSLETAVSRNNLLLSRDWNGNLDFTYFSPTTLGLSSEFSVENEADLLSTDDFGSRYGGSFELYLPEHTTGPLSRRTRNGADLSSKILTTTTFTLNAHMATATQADEERFSLSEIHSASVGTTTLLAPNSPGNPSLSFSYSRTLKTLDYYSEDNGFTDDIETSLARIEEQLYFWNSLPFAELKKGETRHDFIVISSPLRSASYSPSFSAGFSLTPGSRLRNLIFPSNLETSLTRSIARSYDSTTDTLTIDTAYRATALNLFGSLGRYPVFSWYRTEEITHSFGISSTYPLSEEMSESSEQHTFTFGQFLELQIRQGHTITTDTSYLLELPKESKELRVETGWRRKKPFEKDFPFKKRLDLQSSPELVNEEIFDVNWKLEPENANRDIRYHLAHHTTLLLGDSGEATAFARIGFEKSSVKDDSGTFVLNTVGGEIGIEVKLSF